MTSKRGAYGETCWAFPFALIFDRTALGLGLMLDFSFLDGEDNGTGGLFEERGDEVPDWFIEEDKVASWLLEHEGEDEAAGEISGRLSRASIPVAKFVSFSREIFFLQKQIHSSKPNSYQAILTLPYVISFWFVPALGEWLCSCQCWGL